ncbi:hypothetical protein IAI10_01990 [Clostridium sp. 19966]|uniref:hypothetical protein n=1 Tax=Clostridium sp. 19966 TaxID=2768166 RepID=UPI0028DFEBD3|nr:hypothetical protein [Clostridium sp. 19966]MDT8715427.1 hypothetical protein [Clostridium sp. 19966]
MKIELSTISFVLSIIGIVFIACNYLFNIGIREFINFSKITLIQTDEKPMTISIIISIVLGIILGYYTLYLYGDIIFPLRLGVKGYNIYEFVVYVMPYLIPFAVCCIFKSIINRRRKQLMYTKNNYYPSEKIGNIIIVILCILSLVFGALIASIFFNTLECSDTISISATGIVGESIPPNIQDEFIINANTFNNKLKSEIDETNAIDKNNDKKNKALDDNDILYIAYELSYVVILFLCMIFSIGYVYAYGMIKMFKKYDIVTKENKKYSGYLIGADKEHYFIKQNNSCVLLVKQSEVKEIKCLIEEDRNMILEGKAKDINYLIKNYFINNNARQAELKEIFKYLRKKKFYIGDYSLILYLECWRFFYYKIDKCIPNLKVRKRRIFKRYYFER